MHVAGIDAHATYLVVAIVGNDGSTVQKPLRIRNTDAYRCWALRARPPEKTKRHRGR
jgi:hypothetical protein